MGQSCCSLGKPLLGGSSLMASVEKPGGEGGGDGGRGGAKTQVVKKSASVPIVSVCQLLLTLVTACWPWSQLASCC